MDKPHRGREIKNAIATVVMWVAFLIAVIPLVWILWTVIDKGSNLLFDSHWWLNSQRGITNREVGGALTTRSSAPCCKR